MKTMKRIDTENLFEGKRLSVERVYYENIHPMEHVIVKPASVILPVTKDNKIIFVGQVRTAVGEEYLYELPAGLIDEFDNYSNKVNKEKCICVAKEAAIRELQEETGYVAKEENVKLLSNGYSSPGFTNEEVYIFLAEDLCKKTCQNLDEDEDIEIYEFEKEEVLKMLSENKFKNIFTITALYMYFYLCK